MTLTEHTISSDALASTQRWRMIRVGYPEHYAVVTDRWTPDTDRAEDYVADGLSRYVAELLVRARASLPFMTALLTLSDEWEKSAAAIKPPTGFVLDEHQLTDLGAATAQQRCAYELRHTLLSLMSDHHGHS